MAMMAVTAAGRVVADSVVSAADMKLDAFDKTFCNFDPRTIINRLSGCAGNRHPACAFLLAQPFEIDKPNRFIFIDGHYDFPLVRAPIQRSEALI